MSKENSNNYVHKCAFKTLKKQSHGSYVFASYSTIASQELDLDVKVPRQVIQLSRLMLPKYANLRGNIHGGTLIKMVEEAGFVVAMRQMNLKSPKNVVLAGLARIEKLDFLLPVNVGDVVDVRGGVSFATAHSCQVTLEVEATRVLNPNSAEGHRLTNLAKLWYVSYTVGPDALATVTKMPSVELGDLSERELDIAKAEYLKQKEERSRSKGQTETSSVDIFSPHRVKNARTGTVSWTRSSSSFLVGPDECGVGGTALGGAILKMADETAAMAASKHALDGIGVTASMDAVNFNHTIPKGSFVNLRSCVTYASSKSVEVELVGDAVHLYAPEGPVAIPNVIDARFTFVSFKLDGSLSTMPALQVETEEEQRKFNEGLERHRQRKLARTK